MQAIKTPLQSKGPQPPQMDSGPRWTRSAETAAGAAGCILHHIRRASFLPGYEAATAAGPPGGNGPGNLRGNYNALLRVWINLFSAGLQETPGALRSVRAGTLDPSTATKGNGIYFIIVFYRARAHTHAKQKKQQRRPPAAPAAILRRTAAAPARSISAAESETRAARLDRREEDHDGEAPRRAILPAEKQPRAPPVVR